MIEDIQLHNQQRLSLVAIQRKIGIATVAQVGLVLVIVVVTVHALEIGTSVRIPKRGTPVEAIAKSESEIVMKMLKPTHLLPKLLQAIILICSIKQARQKDIKKKAVPVCHIRHPNLPGLQSIKN
jgi:hypothetical protein